MAVVKRWILRSADEAHIEQIKQDLRIHPVLCRLLSIRGINNYDSAKEFFRPDLDNLHSPFLMKGMQNAVERIDRAITNKEKIYIYGDYDVDGTTAVAIVYSFLSKRVASPELIQFYIPHRYREGYGVSQQGIDKAIQEGINLIITLDCGIKSVDKTAYANQHNIDVIICDHHIPDQELPDAYAILNPKQTDCTYPFKELSGCGIGFKLIAALQQFWNLPEQSVHQYLDLVATSIAADIVPLSGENRILAYYGLKMANQYPSLAIKTLKELSDVTKQLTISDLVFVIAPRINAAGRMDDAKKAVDFFIEQDPALSLIKAQVLHGDNFDRREVDKTTTMEALDILAKETFYIKSKSTVVHQSHWHKGVVGIVASRLIDHYYKPTIVLTTANGKITGSARSVIGFNIHDAIESCKDLLDNYGGHFFAAGLTMPEENLELFINRFEEVVNSTITEHSLTPIIEIDAELSIGDIKPSFFNILDQLAPFGPDNIRPVFLSRGLVDNGYSKVVKDAHIKFSVQQNGTSLSGIGFAMADKFNIIKNKQAFDAVYTIDENEWNGNKNLQLKVIDIRPSEYKN